MIIRKKIKALLLTILTVIFVPMNSLGTISEKINSPYYYYYYGEVEAGKNG